MASKQGVLSRAAQLSNINALAALLAGSSVNLFQANINPTPADPISMYTAAKATYDGYVPVVVGTWSDPGFDADGYAYVTSGVCSFIMTGATTPNLIYGAWVQNGYAPLQFYMAGRFDSQPSLVQAGDASNCIIKLRGDGTCWFELLSEIQNP